MRSVLGVCLVALASATEFLIMTLPTLRQIAYVALPDPVLRMLVLSDLVAPKGLAIDTGLNRLYVTDSAQQKIFWYQLVAVGSKLITDGRQHIALESVETNDITVDGAGNLYFTGKQIVLPPMTSQEGVYRHPAIALYTGLTTEPLNTWNAGNTASHLSAAAGITNDNLNVFWGNAQGGETAGSVVRAAATPPDMSPESAVRSLAQNEDSVRSLCLTPLSAFYTTGNGIYGLSKSKINADCVEGSCAMISDELRDPQGIVWDGDGTVYVADGTVNKIYSFPSGALEAHVLSEVAAPGSKVHGLALLQVVDSGAMLASVLLYFAVNA